MGDHLFIKIENINGPSTDPWGPPDVTGTECECSPSRINLLQVDLLASRVSLFWPRSSRPRLVSLAGFSLAFRAKNGQWRDSHLGFQVSFASPRLQWRNVLIPLRLNLLNVCVYLHHRRSKFVYFVRKLSLTMILGES